VSQEKVALRRVLQARRDRLEADVRAEASARITARLVALPEVARARCVLTYLSFGSEFDTAQLLQAFSAREARTVLPRVDRVHRCLHLFHVGDLARDTVEGIWGIRQPLADRCIEARKEEIDLVIMPGLGFTFRGERLGYGGGFYDRLLGGWREHPPLIAPAFDVQIVDTLPLDPHDMPVDLVVTESGIYPQD
jgi:5-formyltetrahydrofolate cyclo-ligase